MEPRTGYVQTELERVLAKALVSRDEMIQAMSEEIRKLRAELEAKCSDE